MNNMLPILYMVIPCYNESEVLPKTVPLFLKKLYQLIETDKISVDSKIVFVDDGSRDNTWEIITDLSKEFKNIEGLRQSRNRGHQNAVLAGMMEARHYADIIISIDADGQDDIDAMNEMIVKYQEGCDVVYGVRNNRDTDTFFKRFTAQSFYKLLALLGVESIYNHADYRLLTKRFLQAFSDFEEVNLFLRGLVPLVGFKSDIVYYKRNERLAGESKYPLSKMIKLAFEGITSLSIRPLRLITTLGLFMVLFSMITIVWIMITYLTNNSISGWASMSMLLTLFSGVQLLSVGIIGEYIGKIYLEVKRRPRYIISERTFK